jgi:hypothetical protein
VDGVLVPSSVNCALLHNEHPNYCTLVSLPGLRLAGLSWESIQEATQQKCSGVCEFASLMWTQTFQEQLISKQLAGDLRGLVYDWCVMDGSGTLYGTLRGCLFQLFVNFIY